MISIFDILKWLQSTAVYSELFESGYCGKLNNKKNKALGVYPLKHSGKPYRAYGKLESYGITGVSLLIHYSCNVEESQYAAVKLFEFLRSPGSPFLNEHKIHYIDLLVPEPVFVGTDENGVYEFVIEFEIYSEKESD